LENLVSYINNPHLLGKSEESRLLKLRETYPYFQTIHLLIAKSHKNQDTFGFNKSLKMASLYAGNRKSLFNFINKHDETAPITLDKEVIEETEIPKNDISEEQIENRVIDQDASKDEVIIPQSIPGANEVLEDLIPEKEITATIPDSEIIAPPTESEIIESLPEKPEVEIKIEEKPLQTKVPTLSAEQLDALFGNDKTKLPEIPRKDGEDVFESITERNFRLKLSNSLKEKEIEKLPAGLEEFPISPWIESLSETSDASEIIQPKANIHHEEKIIHKEENTIEQKTVEISESQKLTELPIDSDKEKAGLEETNLSQPPTNITEEHDFYGWLDNFSIEQPVEISIEEEVHNSEFTESKIGKNEEPTAEDLDDIDLSEVEVEEVDDDDLPGLAEIAYDIQAFVKHPEEDAKNTVSKQVSKEDIDDLLDRFIKKNPSITRVKTEFYKPENMARKSEEFHADVVSETLAGVFYKQGHLHKSLEMYEKLMLQNPDKKDIFAARIKSIKEELINRL
jgi:hypothetical protein